MEQFHAILTFHSPGLETQRVRGWRVFQKVRSFQEKKIVPLHCASVPNCLDWVRGFNDRKQTCGILEKLPSLESFTSDTEAACACERERQKESG